MTSSRRCYASARSENLCQRRRFASTGNGGDADAGRFVRSRFPADIAPRGNVWAGTPAHPSSAFGGVSISVQTLTGYDAAYLETATRRNAPLATLDKALRAAAIAAGVELV